MAATVVAGAGAGEASVVLAREVAGAADSVGGVGMMALRTASAHGKLPSAHRCNGILAAFIERDMRSRRLRIRSVTGPASACNSTTASI